MTLKVGETYKARNCKAVYIVEDIRGGLFRGHTDTDMSILYRADGTSFTAGWSDWEIDLGRVEVIDPFAQERIPPCSTDDRIAALEMRSQKAGIDLASRIRANGELIADLAAKVGELVDRLDGTDRRIAALRQAHEQQGNDMAMEAAAIIDRVDAMHNRLEGTDHEGENVKRRLHQLATDITKLGAELVRIEDMLTAEKGAPDVDRGAGRENGLCGNPECGQCYPNPPRKSMGWIVCTPHPENGLAGLYWYKTKAEAFDRHGMHKMNAIIEIFEGERP